MHARMAPMVLPLFALLTFGSPAEADVPAPNDHLCSEELQERDGSSCETCTVTVTDPSSAGACDALVARGWSLRCGRGATVRRSIYCDRVADFVAVGGSPSTTGGGGAAGPAASGGCAAARAGTPAWAALALVALVVARRRRARGA
jgi:MYXO-CTERM domain-containing protein